MIGFFSPRVLARLFAVGFWLALAGAAAAQSDKEFYQIRTDKTNFAYYELGRRMPARSARAAYGYGRFVIAPDIGMPMAIDPRRGEHMYCNSQVYGIGGMLTPSGVGVPSGNVNSEQNYFFPWTSNMCEKRGRGGDKTACNTIYEEHIGQDCRPPTPTQTPHYLVTAVDAGKVSHYWNGVDGLSVSNERFTWTYLHMADHEVEVGDTVQKGKALGKVWNIGSGAIHLHITVCFKDRDGCKRFDPLPSLIVAYQKALGNTPAINPDGTLAYDPRFEILESSTALCRDALARPSLNTERTFAFDSLWCLDNDVVGLVRNGGQLKFVYVKTSSAEDDAAFAPEPVVFDGAINGDTLSGTARNYSQRCGNRTYQVAGPWRNGQQRLDLKGERDSFPNQTCDPVRISEQLTLNYIGPYRPDATPAPGGNAYDTAQPLRRLGDCASVSLAETLASSRTQQFESFWQHNCSIVGLLKEDPATPARKRFVYVRPKTSLGTGPGRDPLIFDGQLTAAALGGDASHFNARCGDQRYRVSGAFDADRRGATLRGTRPSRNASCQPTGQTAECLRLTYAGETLAVAFDKPLARQECGEDSGAPSPGPGPGTQPDIAEPRMSLDPNCRPLTLCTFNYPALTPRAEPRDYRRKGYSYIADWPGLLIEERLRDSQDNPEGQGRGFVVPGFSTRVAGAALWWYWMLKRGNDGHGYDPRGTVDFDTLARHYAGSDDPRNRLIVEYLEGWSKHSLHYFGRRVDPAEKIQLGEPDARWNLARTMFHHEAGGELFTAISRETFDNSVRLAEDVIAGKPINVADYVAGGGHGPGPGPGPGTPVPVPVPVPVPGTPDPDLSQRVRQLEQQVQALTTAVAGQKRKLDQIKSIID